MMCAISFKYIFVMKSVVQRVDWASVEVGLNYEASIEKGLLVLLAIESGDTEKELKWMANKVAGLRIFTDNEDKMNLSVKDINGSILCISQFTLAGDCKKGFRPSFVGAAEPSTAEKMYNQFCKLLKDQEVGKVEKGIFGAHMDVKLHNDGPVTLIIEKRAEE